MKILAATALAVLAMTGTVSAQDFPSRGVTLIIPYSPGGSTDLLGRQLANELQAKWGQPVVVENRPGAGSMIGTAHLAQSAPDGHTLLLNTAAHSTAPAVQLNLPFDAEADLTPITMVATSPYVMVAGAGVEAEKFSDFLAEAKNRPMFFATAGVGSSSHFAAELLMQQGDLPADVVHYAGGGEANVALMGGHADIYISTTASVMPYVNNGQVKAVGILGGERYDLLPDVESSAENGIEGIEIDGWVGLIGPGGMDPELVARINADVNEAIQSESFQAVLEANFVRAGDTTPEQFQELVTREMALWRQLAQERNIVAQ
ncbi:tripartite tricarboxylate transporter substrate binding protein [Telmatospirillum sp. J64-1]|uniref:Bug family tripartite tricarboxylate transporter substrate binding protein n=1 Tax=Telmatospirillum sp. J64-1 TaxID=2502183 RepID=UPI00115F05CA|nr:tripartite tricarboxylate transporter substrate-binding protein [Telmatospirillum sp. J64-1]